MQFLMNIHFFLLTLALSLSGQLLLKKGLMRALNGQKPTGYEFLTQHLPGILLSPHVLGGAALCGVGVLSWMYVLSMFELSKALPFMGGMLYIALFFADRWILKAETNWLNFGGIVFITIGLCLVSMKTNP